LKRIINVLVLTCAINFILLVGGSVLLLKSSHMDRDKFTAVKKLLFETSQPTTMVSASTQPVASTEPADRLQKLLAVASGRPAGEQVDFIRQTFDAEMAELDRRQRDLQDLEHQIELARAQTKLDRAKIDRAQKQLVEAQEQQKKLASDKGFQDSLDLYNVMPAKQVKTIWMTLSDDTVMQYLQAMEPRTAGKIIKEFKAQDETARIQKVLEKIRTSQQAALTGTPVAPGGTAAPVSPNGPQAALPR
jgi:flagellar motility protein MotE (MotC chaperone)